jgi:hypothetical protein
MVTKGLTTLCKTKFVLKKGWRPGTTEKNGADSEKPDE